ncbi:hypothetical protein PUN28_008942 [Cardiocondyla obscurior]|uniref:Uncharacterized protein n=1 Tax=Cardiocondyla obscurior TaxID=286306 RepID=A0AAW2FS21_9HYME
MRLLYETRVTLSFQGGSYSRERCENRNNKYSTHIRRSNVFYKPDRFRELKIVWKLNKELEKFSRIKLNSRVRGRVISVSKVASLATRSEERFPRERRLAKIIGANLRTSDGTIKLWVAGCYRADGKAEEFTSVNLFFREGTRRKEREKKFPKHIQAAAAVAAHKKNSLYSLLLRLELYPKLIKIGRLKRYPVNPKKDAKARGLVCTRFYFK